MVSPSPRQPRQSGQRAECRIVRARSPSGRTACALGAICRNSCLHLGAACDGDVGTAFAPPTGCSGELDHVAEPLVGDQQQRACQTAACRPIAACRSAASAAPHRQCGSATRIPPSPPPTRRAAAALRPRTKCAPGRLGSIAQRAVGAVERFVDFQPVVVDDRLDCAGTVGSAGASAAARGAAVERLVQPPERSIHLADVAQIQRCIDAVRRSSAPSARAPSRSALAERDDAGEMQRVGLVRRRPPGCGRAVARPRPACPPRSYSLAMRRTSPIGSGTCTWRRRPGALPPGVPISPPCSRAARSPAAGSGSPVRSACR